MQAFFLPLYHAGETGVTAPKNTFSPDGNFLPPSGHIRQRQSSGFKDLIFALKTAQNRTKT
ncbi:hypothetical protein DWB63_12570 [Pseudodesulfovibrio sp. S3]|nr:hypothetical protein DWB63_12570 [Pseudodesulfovibrio sp. S3]